MTFSIPDDVADRLSNEVPSAEQSVYITKLLQRRLPTRTLTEEEWDAVCTAANNDPETQEIEREMASLPDTMTEEWDDVIGLSKAG